MGPTRSSIEPLNLQIVRNLICSPDLFGIVSGAPAFRPELNEFAKINFNW